MLLKKSNFVTPFCKVCFHSFSCLDWRVFLGSVPTICPYCFAKMEPRMQNFKIENYSALALYPYNEIVRSMLFKLKACGDIEMASVFLAYQASYLRFLYSDYFLVPAPSYCLQDKKRGFNHVQEIFSYLKLPFLFAFSKRDARKQSALDFNERQKISDHILWREGADVSHRKVLFVDDILTTGATAKTCAHLLTERGAKKVKILVVARPHLRRHDKPLLGQTR